MNNLPPTQNCVPQTSLEEWLSRQVAVHMTLENGVV